MVEAELTREVPPARRYCRLTAGVSDQFVKSRVSRFCKRKQYQYIRLIVLWHLCCSTGYVSNKFCKEEVGMKKLYVAIGLLALMAVATVSLAVGPGTDAGTAPGQAAGGPGWQRGPGGGFHGGHGRWASELNLTKEQQDMLRRAEKAAVGRAQAPQGPNVSEEAGDERPIHKSRCG